MLQFRAIEDYKGIYKGQVWDLKHFGRLETICKIASNGMPVLGVVSVVDLERKIDKITSTITLTEDEFRRYFDFVR